jgi:hypothetical protein
MKANEFLHKKDVAYMNRLSTPLDFDRIVSLMEEYAALRKTDVSGSYIRIEIVDYFGTKKVIEVKPYFDKQQLTEIEFLNAIRLLEEEKNKATYAFG